MRRRSQASERSIAITGNRIASSDASGRIRLDDVDLRLISALQVDGRRPFSRLGADLGISESSVRYRVQRLERAGLLQIVGIADPLRIGFEFMAMVGVRVRPGTIEDVCRALAELPETSYVIATTGQFDVLVEAICRHVEHFTEFLTARVHAIDGVLGTEAFVILQIHKLAYGWGVGRVREDREPPAAVRRSGSKVRGRGNGPIGGGDG